MPLADQFSGVVVNQNATATVNFIPTGTVYQTFTLPGDFVRGSAITPQLTGFQLLVTADPALPPSILWDFDVQLATGWSTLVSGTAHQIAVAGDSWMTILFPHPVTASPTATYRFTLSSVTNAQVAAVAPNPTSIGAAFQVGTPDVPLTFLSAAGLQASSLSFRILGAVADSGVDFLGNVYRSAAVDASASNVSPIAQHDDFWLSSPCPSHFGVEAMYLDMRDAGQPVVIDRMTIDPLTPGVFVSLYYSLDVTGPGIDIPSWDNLLWTPIYQQYQATRKTTFALPHPIQTKYLKVEFTNLQPGYYDPGQFQVPTTFRKHPKWVLDFFVNRFATAPHDFVSSSVDVTYDLLDLGYSYYRDDVIHEPDPPSLATLTPQVNSSLQFLQSTADGADPASLSLITTNFQPFTLQPGARGPQDSLLGRLGAINAEPSYSVESIEVADSDPTLVSNTNRERLLVEKSFPVMFFYLACRHGYRISQSVFANHVGYFAGVRTLAFHRDVYTGHVDQGQYNEILCDGANIAINDAVERSVLTPLPPLS